MANTELAFLMNNLITRLHQTAPPSGGLHTPPEARLLLYALAILLKAEKILETGYDAGYTAEALALTGAKVIGVDNLGEYGDTDPVAREKLEPYKNCALLIRDAKEYLVEAEDNSFDLIFIDDFHGADHVLEEARQVARVLRPGGIAVFHDTIECNLWPVISPVFEDWHKINLPAVSPIHQRDFGIGLFRKPEEVKADG